MQNRLDSVPWHLFARDNLNSIFWHCFWMFVICDIVYTSTDSFQPHNIVCTCFHCVYTFWHCILHLFFATQLSTPEINCIQHNGIVAVVLVLCSADTFDIIWRFFHFFGLVSALLDWSSIFYRRFLLMKKRGVLQPYPQVS